MSKFIDLKGQKFNRLLVLSYSNRNKKGNSVWNCLCDCGNLKTVITNHLKSGVVISCGCAKNEALLKSNITHGKSHKTPTYKLWSSIKYRCLNPKCKSYKWYGGIGVEMHASWQSSFQEFYDYVGERPTKYHSLDRYPNKTGNYEPGNVRWATTYQQQSNKKNNVYLTYDNKTWILQEWARHFNVKHEALRFHLKKGRTMEQIAYHYKMRELLNKPKSKWISHP